MLSLDGMLHEIGLFGFQLLVSEDIRQTDPAGASHATNGSEEKALSSQPGLLTLRHEKDSQTRNEGTRTPTMAIVSPSLGL